MTDYPDLATITRQDIEALADKLITIAVSAPVYTPVERNSLVLASRTLRRLLSAYERDAGHQLHSILVCGGK